MKDSPVSGSLAMIQPAWHHVSGSNDYRANFEDKALNEKIKAAER
jgi:hypothetical protein